MNEKNRLKGAKIEYYSRVVFDRLAPILENAIFRIVQEALTNACLHSKSDRVRISLVQRDDRLQIKICDWGVGFDTRSIRENRFGLEGIRQRVRLLGGKCRIRSRVGRGSRIAIELPVVCERIAATDEADAGGTGTADFAAVHVEERQEARTKSRGGLLGRVS